MQMQIRGKLVKFNNNVLKCVLVFICACALCYYIRKRYGHGGRVHEIKITDTAEITIAGTNPNPEP